MKKAQILQALILFLILTISYFTFNHLNNDKSINITTTENNLNNTKKIEKEELENSNKIEELSYKSLDDSGNIYEIKSDSGSVTEEDEKILLLKNVTAKILIISQGTVYIKSDKAKYDRVSLNTHFFENVNLVYQDHDIKSDDIFLIYTDKEVEISNNVKYIYKNNNLIADVVNLDLIKKISKIYMKNKKEKVKVTIKN